MTELLPLFVKLKGRRVLLVGGGSVAAAKCDALRAAGADIVVVAPVVRDEIVRFCVDVRQRPFEAADLDGVWLVVAAAPPEVNREVAALAETRQVFVNAVDDPANASAFLSGVVRRDGVTIAISTSGDAPGLTGLLREALDAVLPADLAEWLETARRERAAWRRDGVPMDERRPLLLEALNRLYARSKDGSAARATLRQAQGRPERSRGASGGGVQGRTAEAERVARSAEGHDRSVIRRAGVGPREQ